VGQPDTTNTHGRILYTAMRYALEDVMEGLMSSILNKFDTILSLFYNATNVGDLQEHLPDTLSSNDVNYPKPFL
jgi:hypothetical protein